jgi:hypothetical protein
MVEYTKRRNKNRGYMKLDVWHKSIELYKLENKLLVAATIVPACIPWPVASPIAMVKAPLSAR